MDARKQVDVLLSSLNNDPKLSLNNEGICSFKNNDGIETIIEVPYENEDFVCIYSPIIEIPKEYRYPFMAYCLKLNFCQVETAGGALFISDEKDDCISYCRKFEITFLNEKNFSEILSLFFKTSLSLKNNLESITFGENHETK